MINTTAHVSPSRPQKGNQKWNVPGNSISSQSYYVFIYYTNEPEVRAQSPDFVIEQGRER